jgi:4-hydroxy-tetrahydrodipicolinate reductase
MPLRLAVNGASGRMGRALVRLATERGDRVVCAFATGDLGRDAGELAGVGAIGVTVTSDTSQLARSNANVAIDFSSPSGLRPLATAAAHAGIALVSGTTGLDKEEEKALDSASQAVAVLWEPNMSLGVQLLADLVREAVVRLGLGYDVEVVEVHHRHKADAPSGTALRLAGVAQAARGDAATLAHGRQGQAIRPSSQIGVHSLRGGDVIGDHAVHLLGAGERLELTHRATSRDLFAHGALRAAGWIAGKPAGRYTLRDVLSSA